MIIMQAKDFGGDNDGSYGGYYSFEFCLYKSKSDYDTQKLTVKFAKNRGHYYIKKREVNIITGKLR